MERIVSGIEGFERVDSDLCCAVSGGKGALKRIWKTICEHLDDFFLGFMEGLTGIEMEKQLK